MFAVNDTNYIALFDISERASAVHMKKLTQKKNSASEKNKT